MKYIVTGGAGFIGSNLTEKLLKLGHEVHVIDNLALGKKENLEEAFKSPKFTFHNASICDDMSDIFVNGNFDAIFHLAALPRVQFSIKYPKQTHYVNVYGTLNLLEYAKKYNVKKFIFSSSSSVYGNQKELPLKEDMTPNPMSPYALQKLTCEIYCQFYHQFYGIEAVCLRYFNVYGPKQSPDGDYACLIPKFISLMLNGEQPIINGDGEQTRDFTFVDDVVNANIMSAQTNNKEVFSKAFNIGAGNNISVNTIANFLNGTLKTNIEPIHGPAVVEPKHTRASIDKIKQFLLWEPKTDFKEGLLKTYDYFQKLWM